ncbi:MAG: single-stranded DNA-binding protein [Spirochaetales bacterium]|uniref:Single-stranded DNA-binding protein n=1 Tax=Candidatus Thalassospirochaeta sargassi TaxID=3119039 RepID=A0AAJ1IEI2_9SPIO|nr:single-stranded DNA-binding protein [Spirochaetales bacterium]
MNRTEQLKYAARELSAAVSKLKFTEEITHIYNPLEYAWEAHKLYLEKYGDGAKKIIFLGMNPGPWGMAQTGLPFGEIDAAVNWLGIKTTVGKPENEHPKRMVDGFECSRSEVSGRRLWGLMAERFRTPEAFFAEHWVANYCPMSFMTESGKNFTPDKLPRAEQEELFAACDVHLRATVEILEAEWVLGIGKFAETRINTAMKTEVETGKIKSGTVLHPSPASPAANRGWAEAATKKMRTYGLWV